MARLIAVAATAWIAAGLIVLSSAGADPGPRLAMSKRAPEAAKKHRGHHHRHRHASSSSDGVDPALVRAFSVFRTQPEGLPAYITSGLAEASASMGWNLDFPASQKVQPNPLLPPTWAIPGDGELCIEVSTGPPDSKDPPLNINGLACATIDVAVEHGAGLTVINSEGTWSAAFGLVPDGVANVSLKGNPSPVPVVDNAFAGLGQWFN